MSGESGKDKTVPVCGLPSPTTKRPTSPKDERIGGWGRTRELDFTLPVSPPANSQYGSTNVDQHSLDQCPELAQMARASAAQAAQCEAIAAKVMMQEHRMLMAKEMFQWAREKYDHEYRLYEHLMDELDSVRQGQLPLRIEEDGEND